MTSNLYSTMSIILVVILIAILLESIRVLLRSVRRRLFLGEANLKVDIPPVAIGKERRKHRKVTIRWPVTLNFNGKRLSAKAKDISLGGAFVACQNPLPLQESFTMAIDVPGEKPRSLNAQVVWSNSSVPEDKVVTRGMGVKFVQNSTEDLEWLKKMITRSLQKTEAEQWVANETKAMQKNASPDSSVSDDAQGLAVPARA